MFEGELSNKYFATFVPFTAFSHVMKGVEGYQNEGYTIMTLMRMTFGEFDVSSIAALSQAALHITSGPSEALDKRNAGSELKSALDVQ